MKNQISNLPVIPHQDIKDKVGNYRVAFYATENQLDDLFEKYTIQYHHDNVGSVQELFQLYCSFRPDALEVPGVSELVHVCYFVAIDSRTLALEHAGYWLVFNNQLMRPYHCKQGEPYRFFLPCEMNYNEKSKNFKYEIEEPQRVGKATQKKLKAWNDYLNNKEKAKQEYIANAHKIEDDFFQRLEASGLRYRKNGNQVEIYNGYLKAVAEIGETGIYCSAPEFCRSLNGEYLTSKTTLDFMLNYDFQAVPKS